MSIADFDVVVIGAGIAGLVAAVTSAGLGRRVALVEERLFGGNCSSQTCLPSKTLIRAGHIRSLLGRLDDFGLRKSGSESIDTSQLMEHVRSVVSRATSKDGPGSFEALGVRAITGRAEFVDRDRISVDGRLLSSKNFIIATGTRPFVPQIDGLNGVDYRTNETMYEQNRLPESMIILGGGVDGLEFASAFQRLGVAVTVVEMAPRLLASEDAELANRLTKHLRQEGIRLITGTKAIGFEKYDGRVVLSASDTRGNPIRVAAESVLLTLGRKVDVDGLGLEKAGVKYTSKGIVTDSKMRTSAPNVYACGDVTGPIQLASTAEYQGIIAGTNAALPFKRSADYTNVAFAVFTEPNLSRVGLTEQQAHDRFGEDMKIYRFDYAGMRRAMVDGNGTGMAKIICDRKGLILGAHILGESAAEMIHEFQLARTLGLPLHTLSVITRAYPTYSQAIVGRASQLAYLDRMGSNFFVRQFLRAVPGYANNLGRARDRLAERERGSEPPLDSRMGKATVQSRRMAESVYLLELPAALDAPDERPYIEACPPSGKVGTSYVVVDFSRVNSINGLGATMMVKLCALADARRQRVLAFGVSDHHRRVFDLLGLSRAMQVCRDLGEACSVSGIRCPTNASSPEPELPADTGYWAPPVERLAVPPMPAAAINMNVRGRGVVGPVDGFGSLWQKTYRLPVLGLDISPEDVVRVLKQDFPRLQPHFNHFYPGGKGFAPGEVVAIDSSTPGGPVSTGVMVLYADDRSFTFITPQGHPESGWVTFTAFRSGDGLVAQILGLARANDPVYEAAFRTVGSRMQIRIWRHVLASLATHLGVPAEVTVESVCVDRRVRWPQAGNVWYNAQARTMLAAPVWLSRRLLRGSKRK